MEFWKVLKILPPTRSENATFDARISGSNHVHQVKRYCAKRYRAKQRYRTTFFELNLAQ